MASNQQFTPVLGKRSRGYFVEDRQGSTLFVTGNTPTPGPSAEFSSIAGDLEQVGTNGGLDEVPDDDCHGDDSDGDDSDDDDSDIIDATMPIYVQDGEAFPDEAAYNEGTVQLPEQISTIMSEMEKALKFHRNASKDIEAVLGRAKDRGAGSEEFKKPLIMCLGTTGTGKSSTTNCFVDDLYATKAAASGESCTAVPTVLSSELPGQQDACAAEIYFMSKEKLGDFLEEQVSNYKQWHFEKDDDWSDEEEYDYQALAETAEKILRTLFCDQYEFESPGMVEETLRSDHESPMSDLLDQLQSWCEDLLPKTRDTGELSRLAFGASTSRELSQLIDPHIFERSTFEEPSLWPLVDHVRKGLRGLRILQYVSLMDAPGTADTNRIRSEIAHRFIQDSDALWIVTSIDRVASDLQVDRSMHTYAQRFGKNISIIATRSDASIDDNLAREMQDKKQSIGDYWAIARDMKMKKQELNIAEKRLGLVRARNSQKRRKTNDDAKEMRLLKATYELRNEIRELENNQFTNLVAARNASVTKLLKASKQKYLEDGVQLSVFCVSNSQYAAHKGISSGESRLMDVETTGIPELRRHALRMAASAVFHHTEEKVNSGLALLKGATLCTELPTAAVRDALVRMTTQPGDLMKTLTVKFFQNERERWRSHLIDPLTRSRGSFISAALLVVHDIKTTWHASTKRAFFRKHGNHSTFVRPHQVWNERLTEEQTAAYNSRWAEVVDRQRAALDQVIQKVIKAIEDIPEQSPSLMPITKTHLETLGDMLHTCSNRVQTAFNTHIAKLEKRLSNIQLNATRDVPSAHFKKAMAPMYLECSSFSGKGCTARMMKALETHVESDLISGRIGPFDHVTKGLDNELTDTVAWSALSLQEEVRKLMQDVVCHFESTINDKERSRADKAAREALQKFLDSNMHKVRAIEAKLASIKDHYQIASR
jgi:hypothetical protein